MTHSRFALLLLLLPTGPYACTAAPDAGAQEAQRPIPSPTLVADTRLSDAQRIAALEGLDFPSEEWQEVLLSVGTDRTASDDLRWECLRRHPIRDEYVLAVLAILADVQDGGTELNARLAQDLTGRLRLRVRDAELRQELYRVYRGLLRDERIEVRVPAFRALASQGEDLTIELIREGLRNPDEALIPPAEGLNLLYQHGAAQHFDVLRPYLSAEAPSVLAMAVLALGNDVQSQPEIRRLLASRKTPERVRVAALDALRREDERFGELVVAILEDRQESIALQAEAIRRYVGRLNYDERPEEEQVRFAMAVDEFARRGRSKAQLDARKELIPYLRANFAAIDGYFDQR